MNQPSAVTPRGGGAPPLVELEQVTKSFGDIPAVTDVSVEVRSGEILALLGPNGAGKTTLLRMVIAMLRPDRGRIRYRLDGRESASPVPARVGYLPEERGLYLDVPVLRTLLYFAALRGMDREAAKDAALRWLERLGLADRAGEEMRNLSKGNQQKVQFISSIVHGPELAILDEPFSGLDPLNQDLFLDLIRELRDAGTTVLLSAHQMQLVERLADRVVLIREGRAVEEGTLDDLRRRWGAGRKLDLTFGGAADPAGVTRIAERPGVLGATLVSDRLLRIVLEPDTPLSPLLESIGAGFDVRDIRADAVTLHDIYVRTVGIQSNDAGESPEVDRVAAAIGGEVE